MQRSSINRLGERRLGTLRIFTLVLKLIHMQRKSLHLRGFTIVELLIVVVLIAILAAITIVAYNGLQKRAQTSAVSTALNQASKKVKLYQVDNSSYPATLAAAGIADDEVVYQYSGNATSYCITGTQGTTSLYLSETVTKPTEGGCPGHGQGGVAAVTNLATNPSAENASGWLSNNGSVYPKTWDTSKARSGMHSVSAANVSSSAQLLSLYDVGTSSGGGISVVGGTTYTTSIYFTADVAHSARIGCSFRAGGSYTAVVYNSATNGSAGTWSRALHTCTSPAGADLLRIIVTVDASLAQPAGTRGYVDDLMVTASSSAAAYADGSSPNWIWNGGAHSSTSTGPAL